MSDTKRWAWEMGNGQWHGRTVARANHGAVVPQRLRGVCGVVIQGTRRHCTAHAAIDAPTRHLPIRSLSFSHSLDSFYKSTSSLHFTLDTLSAWATPSLSIYYIATYSTPHYIMYVSTHTHTHTHKYTAYHNSVWLCAYVYNLCIRVPVHLCSRILTFMSTLITDFFPYAYMHRSHNHNQTTIILICDDIDNNPGYIIIITIAYTLTQLNNSHNPSECLMNVLAHPTWLTYNYNWWLC